MQHTSIYVFNKTNPDKNQSLLFNNYNIKNT